MAEVFAGVDLSLELLTMFAALVRYGAMTMDEAEDTIMEAEDPNRLVLAMSYDTLPKEAREAAISLAKTGSVRPSQPCLFGGDPSIVVPGIFKILLRHGWIDETLLWGYGDSPVFDLWPLAKEFLLKRSDIEGEVKGFGPMTCEECGETMELEVKASGGGHYYLGRECDCGPYSRDSHYFKTYEAAEEALASKDPGLARLRDTNYHGR